MMHVQQAYPIGSRSRFWKKGKKEHWMRRFDPRRFVLTRAKHPQAAPDALRRWQEAAGRYEAAQSHFAAASDAEAVEEAVLALQAAEKQRADAWQALRESSAASGTSEHRTG